MRKLLKKLTTRLVTVSLLIFVQFVVLALAMIFLPGNYFAVYYVVTVVLGFIFVLRIINRPGNPGYKIGWIILVLVVPPFGVAVYLIFHGNTVSERMKKRMAAVNTAMATAISKDTPCDVRFDDPEEKKQADYIGIFAKNPAYNDSRTTFYPTGESIWPTLLEKLRSAEKYIFLEYFIIAKGKMWDEIHGILIEKVREGVDVRIIYDDFGSVTYLPIRFARDLEAEGIKCRAFNRYIPLIYPRLNNRDHRKICVVDGKVAFTGGWNIADEYIDAIRRFGFWKDTGVMVEGHAAWSFAVMFLSMWEYFDPQGGAGEGYARFRPESFPVFENCGVVIPYQDNPADDIAVAEGIYLNIINSAKKYLYITTPYLVIDYQIEQALRRAAGSGVDVRIVTPAIPDKPGVFESTKAHYPRLLNAGVKVYEFTPGFMHAKTFVCDDKIATVGTVNLDYRSLYLHFECGAWFCDSPAVLNVRRDFEEIFAVSKRITEEDCRVNVFRRIFRSLAELIAPMM